MSLAVFAPAASCLLPERIGQSQAEVLLLSGQSVDAEKARQLRLVDQVSDDPSETALTWIDKSIGNKSASSLRIAITAARHDYIARISTKLAAVEKLYIDELMQTNDAIEGLNAFLEKRKPIWENTSKGAS